MSQTQSISAGLLDSYVGKDIADICSNRYGSSNINHCAHFVSHVLGLEFGMTCRQLVAQSRREAPGANVRVHEIFAECPEVQELLECPTTGAALIFVSAPGNFRGQPVAMRNVPRKHIGILFNGKVWHYSNGRDRVITQIVSDFLRHYPRQTNALWIGSLPGSASPRLFQGLACLGRSARAAGDTRSQSCGLGVLGSQFDVIRGQAAPGSTIGISIGGDAVGPSCGGGLFP